MLWDNKTVVGQAATSASGAFTGKITIPAAKPGRHLVVAAGSRSGSNGKAALTEFTVTG